MKCDQIPPAAINTSIAVAREQEQLWQEHETFALRKSQSERWFALRLVVGYASVAALVLVLAVCVYILMNSSAFPPAVATAASATLFGDVIGLVATIWKVVLAPGTAALAPVTRRVVLPKGGSARQKPAVQSAPGRPSSATRNPKPKCAELHWAETQTK